MSLKTTEYKYIQLDSSNAPVIIGTRIKVVELIAAIKAYGWSPNELSQQFSHLTLSQIYSALAYYWDHQQQIDTAAAHRLQAAQELRRNAGESAFAVRMRAEGQLE